MSASALKEYSSFGGEDYLPKTKFSETVLKVK